MRLLVWILLVPVNAMAQARIPGPGGSAPSGGGSPSYVNSYASFCTVSGSNCPAVSFSAVSGQTVVAGIAAQITASCAATTITATVASNSASLTQIGSNLTPNVGSGFLCIAVFKIDSWPTTGTDHVIFTGLTGSSGFGSAGQIVFANAGGGLDGSSCNFSGNGGSSPFACSSALTPSQTDAVFAFYSDYLTGGTVTAGGSAMTDGVQYAGSAGAAPAIAWAYRITSSSTTPSYTDTSAASSAPVAVLGGALK